MYIYIFSVKNVGLFDGQRNGKMGIKVNIMQQKVTIGKSKFLSIQYKIFIFTGQPKWFLKSTLNTFVIRNW